MPKGTWGNMIIITLTSKDEPRDKRWCEHYRKTDKLCCMQNLKCVSSSHCPYYKKKNGIGPIEVHDIPANIEKIIIAPNEFEAPEKTVHTYIPGRNPSFGEKMIGKVVMTKGRGKIHIGEVIAEDHDTFTIERDSGEIRKHMRKETLRAKSVWIIDEYIAQH